MSAAIAYQPNQAQLPAKHRRATGHRWAVRWGPLEEGDLSDRARLDAVIAHYRPAAVMHFAAYAYVGESVQDPGKYYRNNVAGTLILLEAMPTTGLTS